MNAPTAISGAAARSVTRRLSAATDLLALYAQLSDSGRRPDTAMIETAAGRSLILEQAAVRITGRGSDVIVDAVSPGGQAVLEFLQRELAGHVRSSAGQRLALHFARSAETDAEKRLLAASPFDVLRTIQGIRSESAEEPLTVCLVGVIGFDHVDLFEDLPPNAEDSTGFPDFIFWLAESAIVQELGLAPRIVSTAFMTGDQDQRERSRNSAVERLAELASRSSDASPVNTIPGEPADVSVDLDDQAFAAVVAALKDHILRGDVYQIVLSRTFSAACPDPLSAFARLRKIDRSPYLFFASMPDCVLFGASPETSVRVSVKTGSAIVEVKPIAGTRPRGASQDEDDRMEADLRLDSKEVAEHMMLVDLARNDVARVSAPGTRHVAQLMTLEKYARVMHLVSSVKGALDERYDALHALQACLNVGTLSGAPKLKATELLRRYERTRRGPYGGAIGWLNGEGSLDTSVIIRSALVKDGMAFVRAGAGIVHDSDPRAETDETRHKASAVLSAIGGDPGR